MAVLPLIFLLWSTAFNICRFNSLGAEASDVMVRMVTVGSDVQGNLSRSYLFPQTSTGLVESTSIVDNVLFRTNTEACDFDGQKCKAEHRECSPGCGSANVNLQVSEDQRSAEVLLETVTATKTKNLLILSATIDYSSVQSAANYHDHFTVPEGQYFTSHRMLRSHVEQLGWPAPELGADFPAFGYVFTIQPPDKHRNQSIGTTALNLRFSCLGEHAHNVTFNVSAQMLVLQIVNLRLELDVLNKEMPELYPGRCVNEVCVKRCVESYASHACSLKVNLQCSTYRKSSASRRLPVTVSSLGGVTVVTLGGALLLWWYIRGRQSKSSRDASKLLRQVHLDGPACSIQEPVTRSAAAASHSTPEDIGDLELCQTWVPRLQDILVNTKDVEIGAKIGSGAYGHVMKGTIRKGSYSVVVAIKTPKAIRDSEDVLHEALMMKGFSHTNVVRLKGVCISYSNPPLVCLEYLGNGDLRTYLLRVCEQVRVKPSDWNDRLVSRLTAFCIQIASGMVYLASKNVVHRDLAARNCLLSDHFEAKVGDFGLAIDLNLTGNDYYRMRSTRRLPVKWMAIESLVSRVFTSKSDVWSFGVVLWEIFSLGRAPYKDTPNDSVKALLEDGGRLDGPVRCPPYLSRLMKTCWESDPHARPGFSSVYSRIAHDPCTPPYVEFGSQSDQDRYADAADITYVDSSDANLWPARGPPPIAARARAAPAAGNEECSFGTQDLLLSPVIPLASENVHDMPCSPSHSVTIQVCSDIVNSCSDMSSESSFDDVQSSTGTTVCDVEDSTGVLSESTASSPHYRNMISTSGVPSSSRSTTGSFLGRYSPSQSVYERKTTE